MDDGIHPAPCALTAGDAEGEAGGEVAAVQATGNPLPGACPPFCTLDSLALQVHQPRYRRSAGRNPHR